MMRVFNPDTGEYEVADTDQFIEEMMRRSGILATTKSVVEAFACGGDFLDMAAAKARQKEEEKV
jgi:hypothetical protein